MDPQSLSSLLSNWRKEAVKAINTNFTAQNIQQHEAELNSFIEQVDSLQQTLNKYVPLESQFKTEVNQLIG